MRKAPIIDAKELDSHFLTMMNKYPNFPNIMPRILGQDLGKIQFDWENYEIGETTVLYNNLPVRWCWAGGDWEIPVHFILYWDGKKIRGYIPEYGNVYNHKKRAAFGNEDEPIGDERIPHPVVHVMIADIVRHFEII